jgi:hypothetical protein
MPKVTSFESDLSLDLDYVESKGDVINENEYMTPGTVFTMNYTETINNVSKEATVPVTVVSIRRILEDQYGDVYLLGCVLKPEVPIYVCEYGAYYARSFTLSTEETMVAVGNVLKII